MKIESIELKNFRCFGPKPVKIGIEPAVTALVGGNGTGKTALLLALSRMFGVTKAQRSVTRRDFHVLRDQKEIEAGASLLIDVVLAFPELAGAEDDPDGAVPEFFRQMSASAPGAPLKARLRLRASWAENGTPEGFVDEDMRWIRSLDDGLEWDDCKKVQPVERSAIQLVYVPASRNAADQVTALLKGRLWQAALWSGKFRTSSARSASLIQKRFEREEPARFILERLTKRWQQVHEADTDTSPALRLVETRLEDLVRRAEFAFFPDESGRERELADLSDGQRSLFHIALTAATLEVERDAFALPAEECSFDQEKLRRAYLTLLAIEEPENSLSPFFLSRIIAQAREIGRFASAQVLISSHSPSILGRIEPEEVRYFRQERSRRCSSVRKLNLPENDADASQYVRLAVKAYPELYFARFVVLAEGDSERLVIPRIAEAAGIALDPSFVPIVPLGGRHVAHFWRLLSDLDIPYATLLDLDLGRAHGGANAIRSAVANLAIIGNDLSDNVEVLFGDIDLDDLPLLDDSALTGGSEANVWLQALRRESVFFSSPLDLDFSMLAAFPDAYRRPHPGGRGPRTGAAIVEEKKRVTLKTGGNPTLYDNSFDEEFCWYPYLFLNRSKPETHLAALSSIDSTALFAGAPSELRTLIEHIRRKLGLTATAS